MRQRNLLEGLEMRTMFAALTINGTNSPDTIAITQSGNGHIVGNASDNRFDGDAGTDTLEGAGGNDMLIGDTTDGYVMLSASSAWLNFSSALGGLVL